MNKLKEAQEQLRTLSLKALAIVEDPKRTAAQKRAEVEAIEPDIKALEVEISDLTYADAQLKRLQGVGLGDGAGDPAGDAGAGANDQLVGKSIGEQFVSSANYQALMERGLKGNWSSGQVEVKTLLSEGTAGTPGPGFPAVMTPQVIPGVVDIRFMALTIADLFPQAATASPLIRYLVESAVTNAAAATAEGALKPESAITLSNVDASLKKITTFFSVTDEMLEDYTQIRGYLDARLSLFVRQQEEAQLLNGSGVAPNLTGLLNRAGLAPAIPKGGAAGPPVIPASDNDMDAIYRQITQIRTTAFLEPDAIVIDPQGWQSVLFAKNTSTGVYYAGGPFASSVDTLWGKRVVVTPRMPANTALVGAFAQGGQIWRKGGLTLEASNSHSDYFQRNQTAIRAEERLELTVYRPGAFGTVTGL